MLFIGFDSHIGPWTHAVDYYNRMVDYRDFPNSPQVLSKSISRENMEMVIPRIIFLFLGHERLRLASKW